MYDDNKIVKERQKAIRREFTRRGILATTIQYDGGWENSSTVLSYFPAKEEVEPATMSVAALHRFIRTQALPIDLLSMLLPEGYSLVRVPEGIDHDEVASAMQDFLTAKHAAHHPESEAGREIGPGEDKVLRRKLTVIQGSAAA